MLATMVDKHKTILKKTNSGQNHCNVKPKDETKTCARNYG